MTVELGDLLSGLLCVGLIVLVIVFIVLGIKLIRTLNKVDVIIDDVNSKMNKVDGLFDIIDRTTDYASSISDKFINAITTFIGFFIRGKKKKAREEEEVKNKEEEKEEEENE